MHEGRRRLLGTWGTLGAVSGLTALGGLGVALGVPASAAAADQRLPASEPPPNPAMGRGGWPVYHRNNHAQASAPGRGPEPGDRVEVQVLRTPGDVSPWTVLGAPLPNASNGAQLAWGSSRWGVWKVLLDGPRFTLAGSMPLDRGRFDFDYGIVVLADESVLVGVQQRNEFLQIASARDDDPLSPLVLRRRWKVPESVGRLSTHFSLAFDGRIIFLTRESRIGALDRGSGQVTSFALRDEQGGDFGTHNSFPLDEAGGVYVASQRAVTRVDWNGREFKRRWLAPIDLRGPGCPREGNGRLREALAVARGATCTGSGTTPTLLGTPEAGVVVLVDGWSPANRMIALWRGEPPAGWPGLPGHDRQIAAILPLPLSTPEGNGFTMENSPAAWGDGIVCAQWNGLFPACDSVPGVQKMRWDAARRELTLAWSNAEVAINGVLTIAAGSRLVYGSGRNRNCEYRYRALDWDSGKLVLDVPLGDERRFVDQGNQNTLTADRSVIYGSAGGLVRIWPRG
jgi:hypothetical protein